MTQAVVPAPRKSTVEAVLIDVLDREWERQCARAAPLAMTASVRGAIELVFAGAPGGIFALAPDIRDPAESPQALLERLRDRLPSEIPGWNMRALGRAGCLSSRQRSLPPPEASPLSGLPPGATAADDVRLALVAPKELQSAPGVSHEAAMSPHGARPARPAKRVWSPRAAATAAVGGSVGGACCGLLSAAVAVPDVLLGAVVGAFAAILGVAVGVGARGGARR